MIALKTPLDTMNTVTLLFMTLHFYTKNEFDIIPLSVTKCPQKQKQKCFCSRQAATFSLDTVTHAVSLFPLSSWSD